MFIELTRAQLVRRYVDLAALLPDWEPSAKRHRENAEEHKAVYADGGVFDGDATREAIKQVLALLAEGV